MTYNEFDDPPRGGFGFLGNVGPKAAFLIVLIALSFMIGVVWKLYVGGDANTGQEVPIVRANDNPFKVEPDEPGGMEIPHKDSTIFSSLNSGSDKRIENLLADSDDEEPVPRSQLFAGLNTDEPNELSENTSVEEGAERLGQMTQEAEKVVETMIDDGVESVMPPPPSVVDDVPVVVAEKPAVQVPAKVEPAPTPVKVEAKPEPIVTPKAEVKPVVKPVVAPKVTPKTTPTPVKTSSGGDYYVQLGSVKSADGAEGEWKKIVAKYPSILSGYAHRVETADLGGKGTFYRIQAGPVSKDTAVSACEAIKKINPQGCLLKKK